jgi:Skp family chaperone for outer membrane proteins
MIRTWQCILIAAVILALAPSASAGGKNGPIAEINIRVIYAVKDKVKSVAPELEDIKGELQELPFSKFRLLDKLEARVAEKSTVELQFPGKRSIAVTFRGLRTSMGKKMISLQLSIKPALKIRLRVADGGRTLLLGPSHLEGNLILDVSAKLEEKKK